MKKDLFAYKGLACQKNGFFLEEKVVLTRNK